MDMPSDWIKNLSKSDLFPRKFYGEKALPINGIISIKQVGLRRAFVVFCSSKIPWSLNRVPTEKWPNSGDLCKKSSNIVLKARAAR